MPCVSVSQDCLFCRIVAGDLPADVIRESERTLAFRDINPQAPSHVLIIPREHVPSLNQLRDPEVVGRMAMLAAEIAKQEGIADSGYRTVINTNADAGQTVFHIHMHLLGGRGMGWPPG